MLKGLSSKLNVVSENVKKRYIHTKAGQWEWRDHFDSDEDLQPKDKCGAAQGTRHYVPN
tara:strand:+ start:1030 stop:1206 length:177 start_codon:yes stop_codon:yes gene_type:complete